MKKLITEMKNGNKAYIWLDGFDGGTMSKYAYTRKDEAMNAARKHIKDMRFVKYELNKLQKKHEAFVNIYLVSIVDSEENDVDILEEVDSVPINEHTLIKVY